MDRLTAGQSFRERMGHRRVVLLFGRGTIDVYMGRLMPDRTWL
jgi:hypothetical protein